jgi:ribonuclease Z
LHGDHFFGLIGLLNTFSLHGRKEELHVFGPKGIKEIILLQQKYGKAWTSYPLRFHELDKKTPELIFEDSTLSVETIPLDHRVYTNGFLFREKPKDRTLLVEKAEAYDIDIAYYKSIKKGKDITLSNGKVIPNEELTEPPEDPKSYAFCSDTRYQPEMAKQLKDVHFLYHESTFLEKHSDLCEKTKHSTAKEAAVIAKKSNVKELILGHFSARYKNREKYREAAEMIFADVSLASDRKVFEWK